MFFQKYGYSEILQPCLDDLCKLEAKGIKVNFENIAYLFKGGVSMAVADNVATYALGGFFCNFSTVKRFCRFCKCTKDQLADKIKIDKMSLRTEKGYNNNIKSTEQDSKFSSVCGIKTNPCLYPLKYNHGINGLPLDLAHDVFEGIAADVLSDCIRFFCKNSTFSPEFLNNQISLFDFTKLERRSKPQPLNIISGQNFKIKQLNKLPVRCGTS